MYVSWNIEEMRRKLLKCVLSSPVEEERGENCPYELSLNYAESMKAFTGQLVSLWDPLPTSLQVVLALRTPTNTQAPSTGDPVAPGGHSKLCSRVQWHPLVFKVSWGQAANCALWASKFIRMKESKKLNIPPGEAN